jgi:alpha-L-arabinofuranosidase B-like protein/glycosyl hydrolase family 2
MSIRSARIRIRRGVAAVLAVPLVLGLSLAVAPNASAADWQPKTPRLSTPWTSQVPVDRPLPEYPRPQLTRPDWQNLNGIWDFAVTGRDAGQPSSWPDAIRVPFVAESALSGIQRRITQNDKLWYRRSFTVPTGWSGRRVQLNFGASDWQTTVWVNGTQVGATHSGGYDAFSYDITPRLVSGANTVVVSVYDPTDTGQAAIGKQRLEPSGIFYTAASGIWQTVWLEPTRATYLTRLDLTPDLTDNTLRVTPRVTGSAGRTVRITVSSGGTNIATATGAANTEFRVAIANPHLWSPDDPFLYDVKAELLDAGGYVQDTVGSYTGMRSIGLATVGGALRPVLNGKFVFQMGTLDQGYWPDGIYTAPTDEALKFDLQKHKDLGYNMVRKHIKVEPQRWFYWADRLGLMVWQDMPATPTGRTPDTANRTAFENELRTMIDQHRSSPSVVHWIPFNEGWGEYDPARIADLVKAYDPSRLVTNNSGSNCCGFDGGNGDFVDEHVYVGPGNTVPSATRAASLGEYGGLGLKVAGHEWSPETSFSYENQADAAALTNRYTGLIEQIRARMRKGLSAAVYTEITDVEGEVNGVFTYDRQVQKMPTDRLLAAHRGLIDESRTITGPLAKNALISLQVTTPGLTDRYLRHADSLAATEVVSASSADSLKLDSTFWTRPGLADPACASFESRNFPGQYLRHANFRVRKDANDGSALYAADATFCPSSSGGGVKLESYNIRGSYLRHYRSEVYIARSGGPQTWDTATSFGPDTTWAVAQPWWHSGADLPVGQARSFRVTTPGFSTRYLRHRAGLARTDVVDAGSDATLKSDATFIVRRGLADSSCYSLESRNVPGQYLRHRDFRVRLEPGEGALYNSDATFCAQPGTGGVSLVASNIAGSVRHYAEEVFVATDGGGHAFDASPSYTADTTWAVEPAWAP